MSSSMTDSLPRDRISKALTDANDNGRVSLVPFVTAGYPDKDAFISMLRLIAAEGDVVEIGVPFSDPMADGVTIQRFLTASAVMKREPVHPRSNFVPSDEKVYAFVEVSNASESAKRLLVHFIGPEGKVSGGIELEIPAAVPRWRTWAYPRHFDVPGLWRVEIRNAEGELLGALPFEVEAEL